MERVLLANVATLATFFLLFVDAKSSDFSSVDFAD